MKYWLLTTEYPPFFGGGISTYCHFTSKMLAEKGHEVSVFVNDPSVNNTKTATDNGVRLIRFNPSRTNSSAFLGHVTNISYEFSSIVREFIAREGKPDIVEAQEYLGIAYFLLQYKYLQYDWCRDLRIVITAHSPSFLYLRYNHVPVYRYPNYWIGEMEKFCLQAADLVISPSRFLADTLKDDFNISNPNTVVIPNPYSSGPPAGDFNHTHPRREILFYGKLSGQKGTFKLLEYFSVLWSEGFNYSLRLVGGQDIIYHPEGKTYGDIVRSRYAKYMQEGKLILQNKIRPETINDHLKNAALVVIPSTVDNLPYVALEMMGMGNIVLVSKQGGQAEIVDDGKDGFVFDHDQPGTFFSQVKRIVALDNEERRNISINAVKKIVTGYNTDVVYEQKIRMLNDVLRRSVERDIFPFVKGRQGSSLPVTGPYKKGLLSIIVTFYNSGIYLDEVIKCLDISDYKEKEIIIVDDGSTDTQSIARLQEYAVRPGIRVVSKSNKGLGDTRNCGAEAAAGEFLTFLDADDKVDPQYYSKCIRVLQKYSNVHFAGSWTQYFEGVNGVWPTFNPEPPLILYHNLINSAALVYKRDAFLKAGKNDLSMPVPGLEDYESVTALLAKGYNGVALPEKLFYYRVRPDSMIRGITRTKKLLTWQYIAEKHKDFFSQYADELANLSNANGPGIGLDNPTLDLDIADRLPFGGRLKLSIVRMVKSNRRAKQIAYKLYRAFKK